MTRLVTLGRVLGLLLMLGAAGAAYWLTSSEEFTMDQVDVTADVRYADVREMLAAVGLAPGEHPNVFGVATEETRRTLAAFPGIAEVDVRAVLPNRVVVTISERAPILVLRRGEASYAVDADGVVLATVDDADAAALAVPVIVDERVDWATPVVVGSPLDPTEFAALLQLGALTPQTIGSSAASIELTIDDENGFVMAARPQRWRAIFGHYTPTLRPPDMIPRQVQCLSSLLAEGEGGLETVYLAPQEERCGTFLPAAPPGPRDSPTPAPSG